MEVVPTLILQTRSTDDGVKKVEETLKGNNNIKFSITRSQVNDNENEVVMNYLKSIYSMNGYAFIINDTSITPASSGDIADYFNTLISYNKDGSYTFDACFLGKFLDDCNKYSDDKSISLTSNSNGSTDTQVQTNTYLTRTTGPRGTEALLLSPSGVKKFLSEVKIYPSFNETVYYGIYGKDGKNGVLRGISFVPSLYSFNPNYASTMNDLVKTSSCSSTKAPEDPTPVTGNVLQFLIFIVVIIIILVGGYCLFKLTPQPDY